MFDVWKYLDDALSEGYTDYDEVIKRVSNELGNTSTRDQLSEDLCGTGLDIPDTSCQRVGDPCCRAWYHHGKFQPGCRWAYRGMAWPQFSVNADSSADIPGVADGDIGTVPRHVSQSDGGGSGV